MLIIPAIDIKDGQVVRLYQGKFDEKKVYSLDPVRTAKHWVKQGAKMLHVVDLDGAATGDPKNLEAVQNIIKAVQVPVECGGGIRSAETIRKLLGAGASRVVLGTKAVQDEAFLKGALEEFEERIIVSIDSKAGRVVIQGWQEDSEAHNNAIVYAVQLRKMGFEEIIYTDISKDGTLSGPNIQGIQALLKATGFKMIASGGVSCLEDISKLKLLEQSGVIGVIIGKALYEGKFTLTQALKL